MIMTASPWIPPCGRSSLKEGRATPGLLVLRHWPEGWNDFCCHHHYHRQHCHQNIYLLISCCQFNFWKSLRWWCSLDFGSLFNQKMVLTVSSMLNKLILMLMLMLMILVILVMLINDDQLLALITLNQKVILQFSHFCFLEKLINERTICFC